MMRCGLPGWRGGVRLLMAVALLALVPRLGAEDDDFAADMTGKWTNDKTGKAIEIYFGGDKTSVVITGAERWQGTFDGGNIAAHRDATPKDITPDDPSQQPTDDEKRKAVQDRQIRLELTVQAKPGAYRTLLLTGKVYLLKVRVQDGKVLDTHESDEPVEVSYTRVVRTI